MIKKIDISHKTIIFTTFFLLGLWSLFLIKDLLILLFVAVTLMSAIAPMINFFMKVKIPKGLSIISAYVIIIGILVSVFASLLQPLIEQSSRLVTSLPTLLIEQLNIISVDPAVFQSQLTDLSKNILSLSLEIFNNLITIILLLVLTFYLLLEKESLEKNISSLFVGQELRVREMIIKIEEKLGAWVRGQLTLSLIIGVISYIGLLILDIPYALPLALLAAVMEVIPVIGPIIAAIPAILVSLTISPVLAMVVAVLYFIIQQLESHLVVPQVMKRAVGLNPLMVILAVAVGSRLLGIAGALLAVPLVVVAQIIISDIIAKSKN